MTWKQQLGLVVGVFAFLAVGIVALTTLGSVMDLPDAPPHQKGPVAAQEPERVPGWRDPSRVAGEEAGAAAGMTYARMFELSHAIWRAAQEAPGSDVVATVAAREGLDAGAVEDASVTAEEERRALRQVLAGGKLARGVIGDVDVTRVAPDEPGPFVVEALATVVGCPGSTDMMVLKTDAAQKMVANLPGVVDAMLVVFEYRGIGCQRGRAGAAAWDRRTGTIAM